METERTREEELKQLGFVRVAAIQALICVSNLYEYAKQNSGPLRSTVGTVEAAVTTVVAPVYHKFKGVPYHLLVFFDNKVDECSHKFEEHAPPLAKQLVGQTQVLIQKASQKAQKLVNEWQAGGLWAAAHCAASESKKFILTQSAKVWIKLDQYSLIHTVAEIAIPTAVYCSEKYNHAIKDLSREGYIIFSYLPLVPIDEIAKAFKQGKPEENGDANDSDSHSD